MQHWIKTTTLTLIFSTAFCAQAQAVEILGNLSNVANDDTFIGSGETQRAAVRFTMPSESYVLDDVILRLRQSAEGVPAVSIHADQAGLPGVLLTILSGPDPDLGISRQDLSFTPSEIFTLEANTTYHLVASSISGFYAWGRSADPGVGFPGVATYEGRFLDSGASWSGPTGGVADHFQINGTLVPAAPSMTPVGLVTLVMLMAGIGFLISTRRARQVSSTS